MLKREYFKTRKDGVKLYRTYSTENRMIRQVETDTLYSEAVDVDGAPYTYAEEDEPIEPSAYPQGWEIVE